MNAYRVSTVVRWLSEMSSEDERVYEGEVAALAEPA